MELEQKDKTFSCSAERNWWQEIEYIDMEKCSFCCSCKVLFGVTLCLLVLINLMVAASAGSLFRTNNEES